MSVESDWGMDADSSNSKEEYKNIYNEESPYETLHVCVGENFYPSR
jgi:hypothetical protein